MAGISAGVMDQQVTPLYPDYEGRSEMGSQVVTWREMSKRWARVHYLKGAKVLNTGETWIDEQISVTMYYTDCITERCRLKWRDKIYEIVSLNGTRREGTLTIKAQVANDGSTSAET